INGGPVDSTIANAYFGGSGMALLNTTSGVVVPTNWGIGSSPGQLPGGGTFVASFAADANSPKPFNGIEEGESGAFQFNYAGGATFAMLMSALNSNNLRVGFHVISIADTANYSDSYITNPPGELVPVPAPLGLAAVGFALVVLRRRKKSSDK
ncbi:MAG: hypothetical protein WD873_05245, partial [Candidatus Hydrogenedentales bacterium]